MNDTIFIRKILILIKSVQAQSFTVVFCSYYVQGENTLISLCCKHGVIQGNQNDTMGRGEAPGKVTLWALNTWLEIPST